MEVDAASAPADGVPDDAASAAWCCDASGCRLLVVAIPGQHTKADALSMVEQACVAHGFTQEQLKETELETLSITPANGKAWSGFTVVAPTAELADLLAPQAEPGQIEAVTTVKLAAATVFFAPCVSHAELSRSLSSVETVEVSRVSRAVEGVESIVCREYIDVENSYRHMTVPSLYTKGQTNRHTLSSEPRSEHIMAQALVSSLIGLIG